VQVSDLKVGRCTHHDVNELVLVDAWPQVPGNNAIYQIAFHAVWDYLDGTSLALLDVHHVDVVGTEAKLERDKRCLVIMFCMLCM
jgi:hypothetical protein